MKGFAIVLKENKISKLRRQYPLQFHSSLPGCGVSKSMGYFPPKFSKENLRKCRQSSQTNLAGHSRRSRNLWSRLHKAREQESRQNFPLFTRVQPSLAMCRCWQSLHYRCWNSRAVESWDVQVLALTPLPVLRLEGSEVLRCAGAGTHSTTGVETRGQWSLAMCRYWHSLHYRCWDSRAVKSCDVQILALTPLPVLGLEGSEVLRCTGTGTLSTTWVETRGQ